jgi:hypothetical protein
MNNNQAHRTLRDDGSVDIDRFRLSSYAHGDPRQRLATHAQKKKERAAWIR